MKKISILLIILFSFTTLFAQAPQRLSYQAVVRDASDKLIANKSVSMRISILQGSASGSLVYSETQIVPSNINGLVTLQIGGGNVLSGTFSSINWASGNYFVKTETDPNGGSNYSIAGTSQLLSVPYALYANTSGSGGGTTYSAGSGINISGSTISNTGDLSATNEIQNLSISGNTVSLSNGGGSVVLPSGGATYSAGSGINISGNTISATDNSATNEIQNLSISGNTVSLSNGGGSVVLPSGGATYSAGSGINISGSTISATDNSTTNEIQNLSISGNTVSLSNGGGSVVLPPSGLTLPYSATSNNTAPTALFKIVNTSSASGSGAAIFGQQGTGVYNGTAKTGVLGISSDGYGVVGYTRVNSPSYAAIFGAALDDSNATGVWGNTSNGYGVYGSSNTNKGVYGSSFSDDGVWGTSYSGIGGKFKSQIGPAAIVAEEGNVGIGTLTPAEKLTIDNGRILFSGTNTVTASGFSTIEKTGTGRFEFGGSVLSNFNSGDNLGTSANRWNTVYATNGTINTSDRREKQNIAVLNYGLKEVMQLKPVTFEWIKRSEQGRKIGFIAQDLQQVVKEVVSDTEWSRGENNTMVSKPAERLGVYYSDLIPVLTKAIQEQQAIIEAQNKKMEAQNKRMEDLEKAVELLKK